MAIIFADGFDSYTVDADLADKWDITNVASYDFGSTIGRFGGGGLNLTNDVTDLGKNFPVAGTAATTDELMFSYSLKPNALSGGTEEAMVIFVSPFGSEQCTLSMTNTGQLNLRRGSETGTLLGSSSSGLMQIGQWFRIELVVVVADSPNGLMKLVVNGTTEVNVTAVDTQQSSSDPDGASGVLLGGPNDGAGWTIDDVLIHGSSGSAPTALLGDLEMQTLRPDGAGSQNDSTAVGAATRWQAVDDVGGNDGDTTYVSMGTAGDRDLYGCANLTGSPATIHAVVINNVSRSDGSDPRELASLVKENVTEGQGDTHCVPLGSTYFTLQGYFPTNPDTVSAWTVSEVNGMELGQKVIT